MKDGIVKEISMDLSTSEVKSILGKPDLEKFEDGETRSLVYKYGKLSIFFDDVQDEIDFLIYADNISILKEQWFKNLKHYHAGEYPEFYRSPSGNTLIKVDDIPDQKKAYVYLQKTDPINNPVVQ